MISSPHGMEIPRLDVVCAVIRRGDQYLACQRSETMRDALLWEFPGGKVEKGESLAQALHREVDEELTAKVSIRGILRPSLRAENHKLIVLHPLLCVFHDEEKFALKEHKNSLWLAASAFETLIWCPADIDILMRLRDSQLESTFWWH